jgi:hypothetical protein
MLRWSWGRGRPAPGHILHSDTTVPTSPLFELDVGNLDQLGDRFGLLGAEFLHFFG